MFSDITEQYSYNDRKAIEFVNAVGVMEGIGDGEKFCPDKEVTNSEVCKILASLLVGTPMISNDTSKFYSHHWAERYIRWVEAQLSKLKTELWFGKEQLDRPITQYQLEEQLDFFFGTLVKNFKLLADKEKTSQENASRLIVAKTVYNYCMSFFEQMDDYNITELMSFWGENALANPYRLLTNIYATGMFNIPKWKDNIDSSLFHKLSLLQDADPKNALQIYQTFKEIDKIAERCHTVFEEYKGPAFQYTTLTALRSMLEKSNRACAGEAPKIQLFMSNAEYLNDPGEGKYFNTESTTEFTKGSTVISPQNTYIVSLTLEQEEQLPMWVQYGGDGTGCRIEFDITDHDNFKKVRYLPSGDSADTSVKEIIQSLLDIEKSEKVVFEYVTDVISKIKYQVKSAYYSHEKEVRHSTMQLPQLAKEFSFSRDGEIFPRLYCELERPLEIKSVMLGPKCQNVNATALFLYRCGVPEVKTSSIEFR